MSDDIAHALAEHVEIVDAIRARDPARAEAAMRQHIRHSHESRILVVSDSVRHAMHKRTQRQTPLRKI